MCQCDWRFDMKVGMDPGSFRSCFCAACASLGNQCLASARQAFLGDVPSSAAILGQAFAEQAVLCRLEEHLLTAEVPEIAAQALGKSAVTSLAALTSIACLTHTNRKMVQGTCLLSLSNCTEINMSGASDDRRLLLSACEPSQQVTCCCSDKTIDMPHAHHSPTIAV